MNSEMTNGRSRFARVQRVDRGRPLQPLSASLLSLSWVSPFTLHLALIIIFLSPPALRPASLISGHIFSLLIHHQWSIARSRTRIEKKNLKLI